ERRRMVEERSKYALESIMKCVMVKTTDSRPHDALRMICIKVLRVLIQHDLLFQDVIMGYEPGPLLMQLATDQKAIPSLRTAAGDLFMVMSSRSIEMEEKLGGSREEIAVSLISSAEEELQEYGVRTMLRLSLRLAQHGAIDHLVRISGERDADDVPVQLYTLQALSNMSTNPSNQVMICRRAIGMLLHITRSDRFPRQVRKLAAGCLSNISRHPANRDDFYRLELKIKESQAKNLPLGTLGRGAGVAGPLAEISCLPISSSKDPKDGACKAKRRGGRGRRKKALPKKKLRSKATKDQHSEKTGPSQSVGLPSQVLGALPEEDEEEEEDGEDHGADDADVDEAPAPSHVLRASLSPSPLSFLPEDDEESPEQYLEKHSLRNRFLEFSDEVEGEKVKAHWRLLGGLPTDLAGHLREQQVTDTPALAHRPSGYAAQRGRGAELGGRAVWSGGRGDGMVTMWLGGCQNKHLWEGPQLETPDWVLRLAAPLEEEESLQGRGIVTSSAPGVLQSSFGAERRRALPPLQKNLRGPLASIWQLPISSGTLNLPPDPWNPQVQEARLHTARNEPRKRRPQLDVILQPPSARNVVHFNKTVDPKNRMRDHGVNKLNMFEHVEGCEMCRQMGMEHYTMPDGRVVHIYQARRELQDEVTIEDDPPPGPPLELKEIGKEELPQAADTFKRLTELSVDHVPKVHRPRPVPAPKPNSHTKHVTSDGFGISVCVLRASTQLRLCAGLDEAWRRHLKRIRIRQGRWTWVSGQSCVASENGWWVGKPGGMMQEAEIKMEEVVEEEVWDIGASIFAPRKKESDARDYLDNEKVYRKMLELDISRLMQKENFCRLVGAEMEELKAVLWTHLLTIYSVFYAYICQGTGESFSMGLNEYTTLLSDSNVPDPDSKYCKLKDCDSIFIQANFNPHKKKKEAKEAKYNADNVVLRFEFIELAIRIAVAKYGKEQRCTALSEALTILVEENFKLHIPSELQEDPNNFRRDRLYNIDVDRAFTRCVGKKMLNILFHTYKLADRGKGLCLERWLEFLADLDIYNTLFSATMREAKMVFLWARMMRVDELKDPKVYNACTFVEFLEALARMCDVISIPPKEALQPFGFETLSEYAHHVLSGGRILERRPSANLEEPKTQPLSTKLEMFLPYMLAILCEKWEVQTTVQLQRKLSKYAGLT
ncbi:hypothetical protein CYMTET_7077, partial [Cymbomonas tetramitiformis]